MLILHKKRIKIKVASTHNEKVLPVMEKVRIKDKEGRRECGDQENRERNQT